MGTALRVWALLLAALPAYVLAHAQDCVQPVPGGCPLEFGRQASGALAHADDAHLWRTAIATPMDVTIVLSGLDADYRLYVYGPDLTLVAISDNSGSAAEIVEISGAAPGDYQVFVDAPRGQVSSAPYRLLATATESSAARVAPPPAVVPAPERDPLRLSTLLLSDDFDDPVQGALARFSSDPRWEIGYDAGEYRLNVLGSVLNLLRVRVPGVYPDASIAVDGRLVGDPAGRYLFVECRRDATTGNTYRFGVQPDRGTFSLQRWDSGTQTFLTPWSPSGALRRGNEPNRLELTCAGDVIAASVNGSFVGQVQDSTYQSGQVAIGIARFSAAPVDTGEARFDNLVLTGP